MSGARGHVSPYDVTPGTVYLVGAGPGDRDLVTQRAIELVAAADILLVDRLGTAALVPCARNDAEIVDVGKVAGDHALPQDAINALLVESARAGKIVVRLKGGDPYLFGRGGEEALACRAAGVPFEVVPAVTSAFSGAAAAGIPVTHRDLSRHVTVVTASAGRDGSGDPNYAWLAQSDGTIVLLMGLRRIAHIAEQLIAHGMSQSTPTAVISRATTSEQRTVTGSLATIGSLVERAQLPSPAIIVIGEVVALRDELAWFEQRPLFGTRIGVTRARAQASELVARLERLGAQVVETPLIRTVPLPLDELDAAIDAIAEFATVVFTSRNGVDHFFTRLFARGFDARSLRDCRIAVVGAATNDALRQYGLRCDVLPPQGQRTSVGLLEVFGSLPIFGTRCLIVRAETGDERLPEGLERLGVTTTLARVYRTIVDEPDSATAAALMACDVITLTSESTARRAASTLPDVGERPPVITIGPTTTSAARWAGFTVLEQAADANIDAVVDAVVARATANRGLLRWNVAADGMTVPGVAAEQTT
ncbi:MAG: uroporphyrin-III C-methyltransferase [Thermoleophilia bacterium]|nr:uroporphyrin-III C-methyltransferase [Thermoleophilia bacterium]